MRGPLFAVSVRKTHEARMRSIAARAAAMRSPEEGFGLFGWLVSAVIAVWPAFLWAKVLGAF